MKLLLTLHFYGYAIFRVCGDLFKIELHFDLILDCGLAGLQS